MFPHHFLYFVCFLLKLGNSKNRKLNVDKKNRQTKNGKIGHRRPVLIMGEINWFGDGSWKLFIFYPGIINDDGK